MLIACLVVGSLTSMSRTVEEPTRSIHGSWRTRHRRLDDGCRMRSICELHIGRACVPSPSTERLLELSLPKTPSVRRRALPAHRQVADLEFQPTGTCDAILSRSRSTIRRGARPTVTGP